MYLSPRWVCSQKRKQQKLCTSFCCPMVLVPMSRLMSPVLWPTERPPGSPSRHTREIILLFADTLWTTRTDFCSTKFVVLCLRRRTVPAPTESAVSSAKVEPLLKAVASGFWFRMTWEMGGRSELCSYDNNSKLK